MGDGMIDKNRRESITISCCATEILNLHVLRFLPDKLCHDSGVFEPNAVLYNFVQH